VGLAITTPDNSSSIWSIDYTHSTTSYANIKSYFIPQQIDFPVSFNLANKDEKTCPESAQEYPFDGCWKVLAKVEPAKDNIRAWRFLPTEADTYTGDYRWEPADVVNVWGY